MNDEYTPDEFARLMALPEGHPERVRAEASSRFDAMRRMLAEFKRPTDIALTDREISDAAAELERRMSDRVAPVTGPTSGPRSAPAASPPRRGGFLDWLRVPAARAALVFASAVIVAGFGWWATHRPAGVETMRGIGEPGAFEVTARRADGALVLRWTAVEGADAYRIVFLGTDLNEAAHLDLPNATGFALRAAALPDPIAPRTRVSIELVALRQGDPIATTPARTVLLP